jgi:hypothetical protein
MTDDKKTIQALSLDSKMVYERLKACNVGDLVPYKEISTLIGRDSQGVGRGAIQTARRKLLREDYMVFGVVWKEGLKRLSDLEIVATGEDTVRKIRRASSKGFRTITAVRDFDVLPNDAKVRHNTYASVLGALTMAMAAPRMKKLEGRVMEAKATLPLQKTLEAFQD